MASKRTSPSEIPSLPRHQVLHSRVRILAEQFPAEPEPDYELLTIGEVVATVGVSMDGFLKQLAAFGRQVGKSTAMHHISKELNKFNGVSKSKPSITPPIPKTFKSDTNRHYGPQSKHSNPLSRKNNR